MASPSGMKTMDLVSVRTSRAPEALAESVRDHLQFGLGRHAAVATRNDWYHALSLAIRDRILARWVKTFDGFLRGDKRMVAYLSAEFLVGPHLGNNIVNLGLVEETREACRILGVDLDALIAAEEEPGLGNGGLGRLAVCFLESMATLGVPAVGYGIRYEFGIFDQEIRGGSQVEVTDKWLRWGNPWEIRRPDVAFDVGFGGHTIGSTDGEGRYRARWQPQRVVRGVAYDTPVLGYQSETVDMLRLWNAEATESFDFHAFNSGDYWRAVDQKVTSENLTKVLYPNDEPVAGRRLRLQQQYFFVACSLQDVLRLHEQFGNSIDTLHRSYAIQLNDTHPSIAVAELMRLLVDVYGYAWDAAWEITRATLAYTNHTLLPEALETWPLSLFAAQLPRHLEIIFEINSRFLKRVRATWPDDDDRVRRMSLIDDSGGERRVRMAHLATVGSHAVNGVAAMHTELLKSTVLRDFHEFDPQRFHNVTNGVTLRRWMVLANPGLSQLISSRVGERWVTAPEDELPKLESAVDDDAFLEAWMHVKRANKARLSDWIRDRAGVETDPDSLFDVQVKRIHEYKRQHLNVLHVITRYHQILDDPTGDFVPRTVIFAGKAAPGYFLAKKIIELIHGVARVVNSDPVVARRLRVAFIPDFNVTVAQPIYPAADLSEQISTAGKEASGTGNMKFALNGAPTIGTLDGANVEILEAVGKENFFLFGLTVDQVRELRWRGYNPWEQFVAQDEALQRAITAIRTGAFSEGDGDRFRPIVDSLLDRDEYLVLADYRAFVEAQERVDAAYRDTHCWRRMSLLNTARSGFFSSDRSIRNYCERIWQIPLARPAVARAS